MFGQCSTGLARAQFVPNYPLPYLFVRTGPLSVAECHRPTCAARGSSLAPLLAPRRIPPPPPPRRPRDRRGRVQTSAASLPLPLPRPCSVSTASRRRPTVVARLLRQTCQPRPPPPRHVPDTSYTVPRHVHLVRLHLGPRRRLPHHPRLRLTQSCLGLKSSVTNGTRTILASTSAAAARCAATSAPRSLFHSPKLTT